MPLIYGIFKFDRKSQQVGYEKRRQDGKEMNDKFFDLKKEKQDRMINAALKVFAMKGYEHASTDDIVKEAGISKGLLFHYFISKLGLYTFVYDYSVKYMMLELSTSVSKEETDYFELFWQIKQAQIQVMHNYPYMLQFLNESKKEDVSEALVATEEKRSVLSDQYSQIMKRADVSSMKKEIDINRLTKAIHFTLDGLMTEQFFSGAFQPDLFGTEAKRYLDLFQKISYQQD